MRGHFGSSPAFVMGTGERKLRLLPVQVPMCTRSIFFVRANDSGLQSSLHTASIRTLSHQHKLLRGEHERFPYIGLNSTIFAMAESARLRFDSAPPEYLDLFFASSVWRQF
jgi:hypothetical protein